MWVLLLGFFRAKRQKAGRRHAQPIGSETHATCRSARTQHLFCRFNSESTLTTPIMSVPDIHTMDEKLVSVTLHEGKSHQGTAAAHTQERLNCYAMCVALWCGSVYQCLYQYFNRPCTRIASLLTHAQSNRCCSPRMYHRRL